jgi:predicted transcriptional regulator
MSRKKLPAGRRKDEYIVLRCDKPLKQKLDEIAERDDIPLVQVIRTAVKEYIEKKAEAAA